MNAYTCAAYNPTLAKLAIQAIFLIVILYSLTTPAVSFANDTNTQIYNNPLYGDITSEIDTDGNIIENNTTRLTLHEAILLAMKNNPELEMSLERELQAGFLVDEAKANFYPQVVIKTQIGQRQLKPFPGNQEGNRGSTDESTATLQLKQLLFDG